MTMKLLSTVHMLLLAPCIAAALRLPPSITRRAVVLAPLAVASAPQSAEASVVRDGMAAFAANRVADSITLYDQAIAANPASRPYLWQRGLALCARVPF